MIARIWSIVVKEFIQIRRDPRTLAIVLAMPVMQLVLFGYAINTTVDHIATVVLDQARDAQSRRFLSSFFNTGYFDLVAQASSLQQLRQSIDAGAARVGIVLPPDFSHDLVAGRTPSAQVVIDGSDPNTAQTALLVSSLLGQAGRQVAAVDVRPVLLYNPGLQSINFMIPGLLGLIMQFQTLLLTAFAVVRERERGTLEQLVALAPPRELRESGLSGTLLEVECEAPVDALELLAHVPGVREVTLYGALLHVLVDALSPEDLARALRDHGQRVISVRPIRPSLEDVFVSRIRSQTDARLTG